MKKVLAGGAVALVGLWVAGVIFFGQAAAIKVDEQIAQLNRDLANRSFPVAVNKLSYVTGFLSGAARIQVMIEPEDKPPILLEADLDIHHGPVVFSPNGPKLGAYYIGFTPDIEAALSERENIDEILGGFGDRDPLTGGVLIDFGGGQTVDLALAPFELSKDGDLVVLENGIAGTFRTDDQFSTLAGSISFGAVSIEDASDAATIDIAASTMTMDITEMYAGNMLTGELSYKLDSAMIKADGARHRIEDVSMYGFSGKNDSGIYGNVDIVMGSIASSDESFKSIFNGPLTARLDVDYEGLEERAIRQYADINQRINQGFYSALLQGDEVSGLGELSERDLRTYVLAVVGLIRQGFTFNYGISVAQGEANTGFNLNLGWVDSQALIHKKTLRDALAGIQANLKVGIDKVFLSGNEQLMQMPVGMGYAVETPAGIESEAQFNRGELLLNGQAIPYAKMLGGALDRELPWRAW